MHAADALGVLYSPGLVSPAELYRAPHPAKPSRRFSFALVGVGTVIPKDSGSSCREQTKLAGFQTVNRGAKGVGQQAGVGPRVPWTRSAHPWIRSRLPENRCLTSRPWNPEPPPEGVGASFPGARTVIPKESHPSSVESSLAPVDSEPFAAEAASGTSSVESSLSSVESDLAAGGLRASAGEPASDLSSAELEPSAAEAVSGTSSPSSGHRSPEGNGVRNPWARSARSWSRSA